MMTCLLYAALAVTLVAWPASAQSIRTPAEQNDYSRYTQYEETARFLQETAKGSCQVIGKTLDAKELPATDLYLCVITREGATSPATLNRKRPTVLIVASQHGNEQSAKEAALRVIRDLTSGDLRPLLDRINFLIMPQANPYGNFVNRRQNEQNLDLNRDHVKLESPETQAIHKVIRTWLPEVSLDLHEKGDDYYRVSTGCVSNINIHPSLERYSREQIFPAIEKRVTADGFTWHEYLVSEAVGSQGAAGVADRGGRGGAPREMLMRPSTTDLNDGRNSPGIYETLSFIQECSSQHDLPTLRERTNWQYSGIRGLLEAVAADADGILRMVTQRRAELLKGAANPSLNQPVHLKMEYVRDPQNPALTIKAFERQPAGSSASGPKVIEQTVKNWLPKVESRLAVARPAGYLIPGDRREIIKTLLDHGIAVGILEREAIVEIESYLVKDIVPAREDYLAPEKMEVEKSKKTVTAKPGDFFVSVRQPGANLIPCLLEPQSEYGLIRYRMYNLVPQKGNPFPIMRVVKEVPVVQPYGTR
jgi:hypothetical protein